MSLILNDRRKYNIIILNHHAGAPDAGGGGRHFELARFLSSVGNTVSVVASSYLASRRRYIKSENVSTYWFNENFNFIRLKTKPAYTNSIGRFINYCDYMVKASQLDSYGYTPDVVIASSVHPLAWVAGHRLSLKSNAKFIVEVRDLWPLSMYEDLQGLERMLVFRLFEALERKYYNLADAIVTTAPYAFEYMEEMYGIDSKKVYHIPHGIDIEEFDRNANLSEEVLDESLRNVLNDYFCVTYTGSLSKSEGLPTFIQAAKYLQDKSDIMLVIVGGGSEEEKLKSLIEAENLTNVVMIPVQPRYTIPLILRKSKILFCGLIDRKVFKYGISKNKFYDYMAARRPIVFASNVRDSLIDKAGAGITTKSGDPKQLANAIRFIYNNMDTVGKRYGANGRLYVEKNHTTRAIAEQFMKVIESC
mgnify:CR=1 FL=1